MNIKDMNIDVWENEKPYFSKVDINFIYLPFVPCKDKFVYPIEVSNYVDLMMEHYIGYTMQIRDDKFKGFLLSKLPPNNHLFVTDQVRVDLILESIINDYFPKEVLIDIDNEELTENNKQYLIFELNRYNRWVVYNGGRDLKDEIYYRFGLINNNYD